MTTSRSSHDDFGDTLEAMTVKELRDFLRRSSLNERGLLSRFKLKRELVQYLKENIDSTRPASVLAEIRKENIDSTRQASVLAEIRSDAPKQSTNGCSSTGVQVLTQQNTSVSRTKQTRMPRSNMTLSVKEASFERVFQQYPPLREQRLPGIGEDDIRQTYHPIFEKDHSQLTGDMDIIFVGTASCTPGVSRGVSCTALRMNWNRQALHGVPGAQENSMKSFSGGTWLFDCGECTQLQVQKTVSVRPGKINKIFITHAHGDHSFGLPGLLCLMGQDRDRQNSAPIDIYGPEGLRMWLRVAIRYSVSRIVPKYRVHELKDIPIAPEWEFSKRANRYLYRGLNRRDHQSRQWGSQGLAGEDRVSWISQADKMNLEASSLFGETEGGRDIYPIYDHPMSGDGAPVWEVEDEEDVKVFAAPMSHSIPCVGYVVEEKSKPGRLRDELVTPIVKRNLEALKEAGFKIPMKALAVIKNLPVGSSFSFPDGTTITQEEAVEPPRKGRKVVICGDTASSRAIEGLAMNADVVVHEATNTCLVGIDKDTDLQAATRDAIVHGHSTPFMAGAMAKRVRAKKLVMNHFSARYKGDPSVESISIMMRLEGQAIKASGMTINQVAAAWDFMVLPIRSTKF
eukprot:CAMPEP_0170443982 /NCGR_PEP_ID=MMETSP0117_2-20130122/48278_1 /TAXON_ID=400756 /ORGANISM="Durinskia baltica, Strain CSIRO CS-38" /LENGTH=625 /DNA_ID=CAMNT_0010704747 /DNA_START=350 /DNA_END=2227 /DNA_ORIENTATION=+